MSSLLLAIQMTGFGKKGSGPSPNSPLVLAMGMDMAYLP
jgi:hypothetical protein